MGSTGASVVRGNTMNKLTIRCPKCRSDLCSLIREIAKIYQCEKCKCVFRVDDKVDKRLTHTTDNREGKPL